MKHLVFTLAFLLTLSHACEQGEIDVNEFNSDRGESCEYCFSSSDACDECTVRNGDVVCLVCKEGFYMEEGDEEYSCKVCAENCTHCIGDRDKDCIVPKDGYGWDTDENKIVECSNNCAFCPDASSSKCYAGCKAGYYEASEENDGNVECEACPSDCEYCYEDGSNLYCYQCEDGFALDTTTNYTTCTDVCDDHCIKCSSTSEICYACESGYELDSEIYCVEETIDTDCTSNCIYCSGNTCLDCDAGYYLSSNKCTACKVDDCSSCNSGNTCISCFIGFSFEFDKDLVDDYDYRLRNLQSQERSLLEATDYDEWQFSGYDYTKCSVCSVYGEDCIECDHRKGQCLRCADGKVWSSRENVCEDCGIEGCVECETPGVCKTCMPGTFWDGEYSQCRDCEGGCAECTGPEDYDCVSCTLNKWTYWHPYHLNGATESEYGRFAYRAPGPFSSNWLGYGLECVSECPVESVYGHKVQKDENLRTCWVEVDENEVEEQGFLGTFMVTNKDPEDGTVLIEYIGDLFWESQSSKDPIIVWGDEKYDLLALANSGMSYNFEECNYRGDNDTNVDPVGRKGIYCQCDSDDDGNSIFWGPECMERYDTKLDAEQYITDLYKYATLYRSGDQNHQEVITRISSMVQAANSKLLFLNYIAEAAQEIIKLIDLVDYDLYPFLYEDVWSMVPMMAEGLAYTIVAQLAYPDKNYPYDSEMRRLAGETTEKNMRSALNALTLLSQTTYSEIGEIKFGSLSGEGHGWQQTWFP